MARGLAIVLSGGGAKGAFQVGVLDELIVRRGVKVDVFAGVSTGAIQALGGAGYTKEWPVERFLRDAKLYDIGAGTNEIRRFLIGRELILA